MAEKAAAATPASGDKGGEKKPRVPKIDPNTKITLLVDKNPKREGSKSRERFAIYRNGMTVGQFVEKGGLLADIRYDVEHKFIKLG